MIGHEAVVGINTLTSKRGFRLIGFFLFCFVLFHVIKLTTLSISDTRVSERSLKPLDVLKFICMFPFIYTISKNFSCVIFEPHEKSIIKILCIHHLA